MTEKTVLQEKLIKSREEKEQLNQRIKLLEDQIKRNKGPQVSNARIPEIEKVISIFFSYIHFVLNDTIIFFFTVATFLWKVSASGKQTQGSNISETIFVNCHW